MTAWYDRAKARMVDLGLTQADLTSLFGVETRGAVGHYLSGRREAPVSAILALAERLGIGLDELLRGSPSPPASHSGRPDFESLGQAVELTFNWLEVTGRPLELVSDPGLLEIAAEIIAEEEAGGVTGNNVFDLTKRMTARVKQGEMDVNFEGKIARSG